ncbi:MAG: hypothetical protein RR847_05395 [Bacilli bacterium]
MIKKGMILITLSIIVLCITGCDKTAKYQELMKEYGTDYYNTYMRDIKGLDIAEVSIAMLKDLNNKDLEHYDLSKLKDCDSKTSVKMILDKKTNKIKKYDYNLKCKR